jgi:2-dehydropantoate 2-reductase
MDVLVIGGGGAIAAPVVAALAEAGRDAGGPIGIAILARAGQTLTALHERGLTVRYGAPAGAISRKDRLDRTEFHVEPGRYRVSNRLSDLGGEKDFILLGLKATEVTHDAFVALQAAGLLGPRTKLVTLQNGVPFWLPLTPEGRANGIGTVEAVDPGGRMVREYGAATIGGFTAAAAGQMVDQAGHAMAATSLVRGDFPYTFGTPDETPSAELDRLVAAFRAGGLNVKKAADIGKETWIKILGNATFNMISVIYDASLQQIASEPHLNRIALRLMAEVKNVAVRLGVPGAAEFDLERRLRAVSALTHKPSTWGDFQSSPADRKTPELDALVGAVVEIGQRCGVPTPLLSEVHQGLQLLGAAKGIYVPRGPAKPPGALAMTPDDIKSGLAARLDAACRA